MSKDNEEPFELNVPEDRLNADAEQIKRDALSFVSGNEDQIRAMFPDADIEELKRKLEDEE